MSSVPRYVPHYTLDDYRQWEGDWELIDGVAIAMTPSPFGPHERVVSRLARTMGNQIEQRHCPCDVYTNLDWIVSRDTVIRLDLMLVCGEQPQRHLEKTPTVVVEVLSESTLDRDLVAKRALCREYHVPHYLVIDPDARTVEHVEADNSRSYSDDSSFELEVPGHSDCRIAIECSRLFDAVRSDR